MSAEIRSHDEIPHIRAFTILPSFGTDQSIIQTPYVGECYVMATVDAMYIVVLEVMGNRRFDWDPTYMESFVQLIRDV